MNHAKRISKNLTQIESIVSELSRWTHQNFPCYRAITAANLQFSNHSLFITLFKWTNSIRASAYKKSTRALRTKTNTTNRTENTKILHNQEIQAVSKSSSSQIWKTTSESKEWIRRERNVPEILASGRMDRDLMDYNGKRGTNKFTNNYFVRSK